MGLIGRIFGTDRTPDMAPLYAAIVAAARQPDWYEAGRVPDTIDGRFEVLMLSLSLVLVRMERDGAVAAPASARLAECFVRDMDGQMRETGFGDLVVGKQVTKAMGALGGRLGAYREGFNEDALFRNLWRGTDPGAAAVNAVRLMIATMAAALDASSLDDMIAGRVP